MTAMEKYAWATLVSLGAIYFYFQMRMLDGWSVVSTTPEGLFSLYIVVVVLSIIAQSIVAGGVADKKLGKIEKDERDHMIEARAGRNEYWFIVVAINVLIFHMLADATFANHIFPRFDVSDTATLFYLLFTILFAGEAVKMISIIWAYRAGALGTGAE